MLKASIKLYLVSLYGCPKQCSGTRSHPDHGPGLGLKSAGIPMPTPSPNRMSWDKYLWESRDWDENP